jgi:hypothetical protein
MHIRELHEFEKSDYPYSINARRESIKKNKEALKTIKTENMGTTFKEAMTSDLLSGFIPDLFLDEIVTLGQRTAIARNHFPVVGQSTQSSFKQRYRWKIEGVQVTSKELIEVKHTESEREVQSFEFLKLLDSNVLSLELIEDSSLQEVSAEILQSGNKFFRRENQLMAHRLTEFSSGTTATKWGNWESGASDTGDNIFAAMKAAYLDITTRLTDRFDPSLLTWFVSPEVYTLLFDITKFQEFRLSGLSPNNISGRINETDVILRIPIVIWEPGYFNTDSEWTSSPFDIFLVATQFAAGIRERWSMRTSPLDMNRILAHGLMMFERLVPYVRNPFAYRRISPTQDYSNMVGDMKNINIIAGTESTKVFN